MNTLLWLINSNLLIKYYTDVSSAEARLLENRYWIFAVFINIKL